MHKSYLILLPYFRTKILLGNVNCIQNYEKQALKTKCLSGCMQTPETGILVGMSKAHKSLRYELTHNGATVPVWISPLGNENIYQFVKATY